MKRMIEVRRVWQCIFCLVICMATIPLLSQGIIIDHTCTDITQIPEYWINQAKSNLHIGYGHTSHGSQLTTGMNGLVGFANGGGLGLSHPDDIFDWNNGGTGGALDLHDYFKSGDLGNPDRTTWASRTRDYLNDPANSNVNVIIWSWCGQANTTEENINLYLSLMNQLEIDYPGVDFVYMTGHAVGDGEAGNLHIRNQQIRNYCETNNKILYDFYDIECYDPDDNYFGDKLVSDDCSYDSDNNGSRDANWATAWQSSHVEDTDWYSCLSAHSQPLNANRKAYAAWWLWASLGGWDQSLAVQMSQFSVEACHGGIRIQWRTESETDCVGFNVWRSENLEYGYVKINSVLIPGRGNSSDMREYVFLDNQVSEGAIYWYKIEEISTDGNSCYYEPICAFWSNTAPDDFQLFQNYPNPFNPETQIDFTVPVQTKVMIKIFNLVGEEIRILENTILPAGEHTVKWDGMNVLRQQVSSGVYFCHLITDQNVLTQKMILMR